MNYTSGARSAAWAACAKGSGMIHPNMATMLAFITTDCAITPRCCTRPSSEVVADTFNMVSVDGDTSTNDMVRRAGQRHGGQRRIHREDEDFETFLEALDEVLPLSVPA